MDCVKRLPPEDARCFRAMGRSLVRTWRLGERRYDFGLFGREGDGRQERSRSMAARASRTRQPERPVSNSIAPMPIGPALQQLRKRRNLTLDALASMSGVSRSMLSQIERGQANPTIATLWALSDALGVEISELIGTRRGERRIRIELTPASYIPEIRTEDGLCVLRILSPADRTGSLEWYELTFAAGGALVSDAHAKGSQEHLTVFEGQLTVIVGEERTVVSAGATARYPVDVPHRIENGGTLPARALLVVTN